jgi:signal peptidase I
METQPNREQESPPQPSQPSILGAAGNFIWDLLKIIVVALVIIVPFRMFIAEPFVVSGHSMLPNYQDKDYLIIDRLTYRRSQPQRGDVVVLRFPRDPSQYFIKRIIGLPGEEVRLEGGSVIIASQENPKGFRLNEPYLPSQTETIGRPEKTLLGSGEYYVLGDNRNASSDSRVWGILPQDNIVGKVWLRVFPVSSFEIFHKPVYN